MVKNVRGYKPSGIENVKGYKPSGIENVEGYKPSGIENVEAMYVSDETVEDAIRNEHRLKTMYVTLVDDELENKYWGEDD